MLLIATTFFFGAVYMGQLAVQSGANFAVVVLADVLGVYGAVFAVQHFKLLPTK